MTYSDTPVRHWVIDGAVAPLAGAVAAADDPLWEVTYAAAVERGKRTARHGLPPAVADALALVTSPAEVNGWCDRLGYAVLPDPTLWGGGLQVMPPGSALGCHLDGDRHPLLPHWRRALTVIAYLHPAWGPDWGGALWLCDPDGTVVRRIDPEPGRLVVWEQSDLAYHGVEPVTGPAERVSVAMSFLAPATRTNTRVRALFLPPRRSGPASTGGPGGG